MFVVAAKRTPFGKFCGMLSGITATDIAAHVCRAALRDSGVPSDEVQHTVVG